MTNYDIKLVLNINTPNYFDNGNIFNGPFTNTQEKNSLENSFASTSVKKTKYLQKVGKAFRRSSKLNKLKINSSLNKIDKDRSLLMNDGPDRIAEESRCLEQNNADVQKTNEKKGHLQKKEKQRVSFSSNVEVFPREDSLQLNSTQFHNTSHLNNGQTTSSCTDYSGPKKASKAPISSLFSKNPAIPNLPKSETMAASCEVFSTHTFNELNLSSKLISTVTKLGFSSMTLVQEFGIPAIQTGNDALIKSQTGSGKTLAYVLPIIHNLMNRESKLNRKAGLHALIVVPSRELAVQTYQWLEKLCKTCVWIVPGYLMGGEKKKAEKARLRKGINILVATPGRLIDHIDNTNSLNLEKVEYLVLDEADRMLDLGYEKSIMTIIRTWKKARNESSRQTILLSATLTSAVVKLADMSLTNPKVVDVTTESSDVLKDEGLVTPQNLTEYFMVVPEKLRLVSLAAFVINKCKFTEEKKMLVFVTTQDMVDYFTGLFALVLSRLGRKPPASSLQKEAAKVLSGLDDDAEEEIDAVREDDTCFMKLHGNMSQPERTAVFKSFHEASSGVLFCTDVASRGLDLPRVNWIVQFNPASQAAEYVHRVGRTARANMTGSALVFVTPAEISYISMLQKEGIVLHEIRVQTILKTLTHPSLYNKDIERVPCNMEVGATRLQDKFEKSVESDKDMRSLAIQGYASFVRSYAAVPKSSRSYLCFKLLHLGHCAKSFALRDPPRVLGGKAAKDALRPHKRTREQRDLFEERRTKSPLFKVHKPISEFDSGFEDAPPAKKKQRIVKRKRTNKT